MKIQIVTSALARLLHAELYAVVDIDDEFAESLVMQGIARKVTVVNAPPEPDMRGARK